VFDYKFRYLIVRFQAVGQKLTHITRYLLLPNIQLKNSGNILRGNLQQASLARAALPKISSGMEI